MRSPCKQVIVAEGGIYLFKFGWALRAWEREWLAFETRRIFFVGLSQSIRPRPLFRFGRPFEKFRMPQTGASETTPAKHREDSNSNKSLI
jgi:hypothetical protein